MILTIMEWLICVRLSTSFNPSRLNKETETPNTEGKRPRSSTPSCAPNRSDSTDHEKISTGMFLTCLFTIAKPPEWWRHASRERMRAQCYVHAMEYIVKINELLLHTQPPWRNSQVSQGVNWDTHRRVSSGWSCVCEFQGQTKLANGRWKSE